MLSGFVYGVFFVMKFIDAMIDICDKQTPISLVLIQTVDIKKINVNIVQKKKNIDMVKLSVI